MSTQEERLKRSRKVIQKEEENRGNRQRQKQKLQSFDEEIAQMTWWDSLPLEIQKDIVLRVLSVYDLGRLKLVSKSLLNLISSRDFIYTHLARVPPKPQFSYFFARGLTGKERRLLAFEIDEDGSATTLHNREVDRLTLLGLTGRDYITHISSCNGLLLLQASATCATCCDRRPDHVCNKDLRVFICNPVTRSSKKVLSVAYGGREQYCWVTFGYDDCSMTYKVVGLRSNYEISVCTLSSSGCSPWRVLDYDFKHNHVDVLKPIVATNGRLILLGQKIKEPPRLFSMDLNKELLREISLPPSATTSLPRAVYDINGCLHCVIKVFGEKVEIWALRRSNDAMMDCRWVKKHVVSMDCILTAIYKRPGPFGGYLGCSIIIIGSTSDGKKLIFHSLVHKKLVSYDLQSRQLMPIKFDNDSTVRSAIWMEVSYARVSSLVSCL